MIPSRIEVVTLPAAATTRFEHRQQGPVRSMWVTSAARPIGTSDIPKDWRDAPLVLLAPVLGEVDPLLAPGFAEGAVGAAAQGWLRALGNDGTVTPQAWIPPKVLLQRIQALFLSREDVRGQEAAVVDWLQDLPIGVLTADRDGALLFVNGERYEVRPRPANEVDATGAGDVFAATFLIESQRTGDPWAAAAAAACAGSLAVEGEGWSTVPDRATLDAALAEYRRDD